MLLVVNNIYNALTFKNATQAARNFYNALTRENAVRAIRILRFLVERLLHGRKELIQDVAMDAAQQRTEQSLEGMELPGLPGIAHLFNPDEPSASANPSKSVQAGKKRTYLEMLGTDQYPQPRPLCPYTLQRIYYSINDLFTLDSIRRQGYETRQDYDSALRDLNEPHPLIINPSAEDPRPDLPQPRSLNPSLWKRVVYTIRDVFPQNLKEQSNRALLDAFLRNERDPQVIKKRQEEFRRYKARGNIIIVGMTGNPEEYHLQHAKVELDQDGRCPACDYHTRTGNEYVAPKDNQPTFQTQHLYDYSRYAPPNNNIRQDLPVKSVEGITSNVAELFDDQHQLLEAILLRAQSVERDLVTAEQEACDTLFPEDYAKACHTVGQIHASLVAVLSMAEELEKSFPPHRRPQLLAWWLSQLGPSNKPRTRYTSAPVPDMEPHTPSASMSEAGTTKRRKTNSNGFDWARKSDPLPTSKQDLPNVFQQPAISSLEAEIRSFVDQAQSAYDKMIYFAGNMSVTRVLKDNKAAMKDSYYKKMSSKRFNEQSTIRCNLKQAWRKERDLGDQRPRLVDKFLAQKFSNPKQLADYWSAISGDITHQNP